MSEEELGTLMEKRPLPEMGSGNGIVMVWSCLQPTQTTR